MQGNEQIQILQNFILVILHLPHTHSWLTNDTVGTFYQSKNNNAFYGNRCIIIIVLFRWTFVQQQDQTTNELILFSSNIRSMSPSIVYSIVSSWQSRQQAVKICAWMYLLISYDFRSIEKFSKPWSNWKYSIRSEIRFQVAYRHFITGKIDR